MEEVKVKWYDRVIVFIAKVILVIGFISVMVLWVGGCVGNFLNVDEDPAPGLHWKP